MKREISTGLLLTLWAMAFVRTVEASTLNDFMGPGYDSQMIQWAAITAVLGGVLRTIFSLQSEKRAVKQVAIEALWDMAKALLAGMLAFVIVQSLRSMAMAIPSEVRFAAVLVAGWSRLAMLEAFEKWIKAKRDAFINGADSRLPPKDAP